MRDIKYRGLHRKSNTWYYGCFIETDCDCPCIVFGDGDQIEVDPETVGQYIGRIDQNKAEAFEGDVIKAIDYPCPTIGVIEFDASQSGYRIKVGSCAYMMVPGLFEIIGNIHESPELLKGEI